jgi:hypothetical protein
VPGFLFAGVFEKTDVITVGLSIMALGRWGHLADAICGEAGGVHHQARRRDCASVQGSAADGECAMPGRALCGGEGAVYIAYEPQGRGLDRKLLMCIGRLMR